MGEETSDLPATEPSEGFTAASGRDLTRAFVAGEGLPDGRAAESLLLVVTELITNARRHAGGVRSFELARHGPRVTVTVSDHDPNPPVVTGSPASQPGGFGWPLVLNLTESVRVHRDPDGKRIDATVAWPTPAPPPTSAPPASPHLRKAPGS
ncbi:ATP-binding protein (plasmid) [Streptomyces sp. BI20]|uniref:ATP-binding protein n=1 Tax=Streptomyces sp. BI20 TaxID=3403460 RepID=UPI003C74C587